MILLTDLKNECESLVSRIDLLNDYAIAASETHLTKLLTEKSGVILASSFPQSSSESLSEDSPKEQNSIILYVLKKISPGDVTPEEEFEMYCELQLITKQIKELLSEGSKSSNIWRLINRGINTEPEYQLFGGHNGYSISINLETYTF